MSALVAVKKFFLHEEEGASLVEYGMLVALIALVCLAAVVTIGGNVRDAFVKIGTKLTQAINSSGT